MLAELAIAERPGLSFRRGAGCKSCRNRGRRGRIALHEVLLITPDLAAAISRRAPDTELVHLAAAAGYRRMIQDGLDKAMKGLVTLEDVLAAARSE